MEKPIWKGYILYDFNYMTFSKRQKLWEKIKKISGCLGQGELKYRDKAEMIFS